MSSDNKKGRYIDMICEDKKETMKMVVEMIEQADKELNESGDRFEETFRKIVGTEIPMDMPLCLYEMIAAAIDYGSYRQLAELIGVDTKDL